MTTDPTAKSVTSDVSRIDKVKATLNKNKTTIVLGTALAASLTLNYLLSLQPAGTTKYFLTPEDVKYLNGLLAQDQAL